MVTLASSQYEGYRYTDGLWYFESALMLYKARARSLLSRYAPTHSSGSQAALSAVVIFLRDNSYIQIASTFAVSFLFVCICFRLEPFKDRYDDRLQNASVSAISITMLSGLLLGHAIKPSCGLGAAASIAKTCWAIGNFYFDKLCNCRGAMLDLDANCW